MPRRLLILDDDPLIGQTIRHIAEFSKFQVEVTSCPEDFFRLCDAWRPDFIALDLIMPEMDGVEVMAELARRDCRSRIIITSGVGSRVLDAAGRSAAEHGLNIAGVLAKPFTPSSLRELLKESVDSAEIPLGIPENPAPAIPAKSLGAGLDRLTAGDLEKAILEGELFVVYQPKVVCLTGVLAGFEALARWRHPELGEVSPEFFIPLAETNDLIDALTRVVLEQSLRWFGSFCASLAGESSSGYVQDLSKLSLSINISALSLSNQSLFDHLNALCQAVEVAPQRLIFELTESSAMEDPVTSLGLLTRLRMKGFQLSIDDFGTGFSSMLQLVRLPFSEIKVDRSFIATARHASESRAVIKSITDLGHSLGLQITAEGIEDEETLMYLRNIGCDHLQGYLIARPMSGDKVIEWLRQREPSNEERRLAALHSLGLLGTEEEERFDILTSLALRLFNVPMASINFVDKDKVWFKSRQNISIPQFPRNISFCTYTIESDEVFIVPDALKDLRFANNINVTHPPHLRFYAGCPIHASDGSRIGTICLLDRRSRHFLSREVAALAELAKLVEKELYSERMNTRDPDTRAFSMAAFEARAENVLTLCQGLQLSSSLLMFHLLNMEADEGENRRSHERRKRNRHKSIAFSRLLSESLRSSDLVGQLGEEAFIALLIGAGEEELEEARKRLDRSLANHNRNCIQGLELRYDLGCAVAAPDRSENLQSLLTQAELNLF